MTRVTKASAITDPLKRCLAMPDPPGTRWNSAGVDAYCRYRTAKSITAAQLQAMIAEGKADAVDAIFSGYLQQQMTDPRNSGRLDRALYVAGFYDATPETRAAIDAWKRQRPASPFAFVASGIQFDAAAGVARGGELARDTGAAQWSEMHSLEDLAREDLERASSMTPKIPTAFAAMFAVGVMTGDQAYAHAALARGLKLQPANISLRLVEADMGGQKWGGSRESQEAQRTEATALAAKQPLLWVVVGRLSIDLDKEDALGAPNDGKPMIELSQVATASDLARLAGWARMMGSDDAVILAVEALRFDSGQTQALEVIGSIGGIKGYPTWSRQALTRAKLEHPDSAEIARICDRWLRELEKR